MTEQTVGVRNDVEGRLARDEAVESVDVLRVVLGVGVALIVVGVVLIPLPGPGLVVLSAGVIVAAVAGVLSRKGPGRT